MKSFTDIEQSKQLAKILPLESADMYWLNRHIDLTETKYEVFVIDKSNKYIDFFNSYAVAIDNNEIIPCWSLAALLEQLDDVITDEDENDYIYYILGIIKEDLQYQLYYHDSWGQVEDIETNYYDDMVDACVEMILKLKEKDLL